jgi:hypothetical protein
MLLQEAPSFSFKLLGDGAAADLTLPKLTRVEFHRMNMDDVKASSVVENAYFQPSFPNFAAVESFAIVRRCLLFPGELGLCILGFQATLSSTHMLKRSGLDLIAKKVAKEYGTRLPLVVVFVVGRGAGIDKRQKLGKQAFQRDAEVRQGLFFVDFGDAVLEDAEEGESEEEESEEEESAEVE